MDAQLNLFLNDKPKFDGLDARTEPDRIRLSGQCLDIYNILLDGKWHTVAEIEQLTGFMGTSISAQIRNLRKDRFGCHDIEKKMVNNRAEYQMTPNKQVRIILTNKIQEVSDEKNQGVQSI